MVTKFRQNNWLYICISGISADLPFFYLWFSSQDSTSAHLLFF